MHWSPSSCSGWDADPVPLGAAGVLLLQPPHPAVLALGVGWACGAQGSSCALENLTVFLLMGHVKIPLDMRSPWVSPHLKVREGEWGGDQQLIRTLSAALTTAGGAALEGQGGWVSAVPSPQQPQGCLLLVPTCLLVAGPGASVWVSPPPWGRLDRCCCPIALNVCSHARDRAEVLLAVLQAMVAHQVGAGWLRTCITRCTSMGCEAMAEAELLRTPIHASSPSLPSANTP